MDGLANILGCGVSSLPIKYLGLPLGAPFKAKSCWELCVFLIKISTYLSKKIKFEKI
jgi:hypothetical protein